MTVMRDLVREIDGPDIELTIGTGQTPGEPVCVAIAAGSTRWSLTPPMARLIAMDILVCAELADNGILGETVGPDADLEAVRRAVRANMTRKLQ